MIDRMDGWGGAIVAVIAGALGMFYRHGSLIAGVVQKQKSQDETNERMQKWLETTSKQLSDIRVALGKLEPRETQQGGK